MTALLYLPDDILLIILHNIYAVGKDGEEYGNKNHLLSVRLVCKHLAKIGQRSAFEKITFIQDKIGLRNLDRLSDSPYHKDIIHLTCVFQDYNPDLTNIAAFRDRFKLRSITQWKQKELFQEYCRGQRHCNFLEHTNTDISILAKALLRLSNLHSIKVLQDWTGEWYKQLEDTELNQFALSPAAYRLFEAIITTLGLSETKLYKLVLGAYSITQRSHHFMVLFGD